MLGTHVLTFPVAPGCGSCLVHVVGVDRSFRKVNSSTLAAAAEKKLEPPISASTRLSYDPACIFDWKIR